MKTSYLDAVEKIIRDAADEGVQIKLASPGKLRLTGPAEGVDKIKPLVLEHKAEIIRELAGGPAGSSAPSSDPWECPTGYARHREFWTSDYGLRICAICHPRPGEGGAAC